MLHDVKVDHKGIRELTMGPEMRSLMRGYAEEIEAIYRTIVAKRTGRLARETRIETFIGGRRNDRWVARLIAYAPYAASHEFGTSDQPGYHELLKALHMRGRL